jgi:DNA-binding PadR family transcriptional regulator
MEAETRPSERRFSNPLALAVLVLLYERPMHPYEMATTLRERGKEQSIKLNYGSLYTVIEQLLREKWIGVKEILKEGRRPEKTVYELMPAGETELIDWMRELVSSPVKEYPQFEAALSLLPALPPEEVVSLLEIRLGLIEKRFAKYDDEARICREMKLPRLFSLETEYARSQLEAEYKYSKALLEDIKQNAAGLTTSWTELRKAALKGKTAAAKKAKSNETPAAAGVATRSQGKSHEKAKRGEKR